MSENTPPSSVDSTTPPSGARRGPLIAIGAVATVLVAGGLALAFGLIPAFHSAPVSTLVAPESPEVVRDLKRPDALIESASLSRLPKAVLEVPLLRDVLTEDFVFYYESNADRLGLTGTLRRSTTRKSRSRPSAPRHRATCAGWSSNSSTRLSLKVRSCS